MNDYAEARAKAKRLGLFEVPCTRCKGSGETHDANMSSAEGLIHRPCRCEGRGFWFARTPDGLWMTPDEVMAQNES